MDMKKIIIGEPTPERDDPRYKDLRETSEKAGEAFADASGLSWLCVRIHHIAHRHRKAFLVTVFGFVIGLFILNTIRFVRALSASKEHGGHAVERVDSALLQGERVRNLKKFEDYAE